MNFINILLDLYKLRKNVTKSKEHIKMLQDKQLRKLLTYAFDHSKYYNKVFTESNITRENISKIPLSEFPTIDKATFLENFDELITVTDLKQNDLRKFDSEVSIKQKVFKEKYHVVHSSGSTGKPGYFVYDESAWSRMLLGIIRAAFWNMSSYEIMKFLIGKPRIVYIAATNGRYGGAMAVGDGIKGVKAKQLFLDINEPLSNWVKQITKFKPNMIIGYPSAIKILGELVEKGSVNLNILRVISCGEPLGASLRHYLGQVFAADVINIYGASESLSLGVEENLNEGMILFDDLNVIEMIDGSMYLTSLYNFSQPIIRYKISDQFRHIEAADNSKYPFSKAHGLIGRDEDLLWFEDGKGNREFLHPLLIEGFCIPGLIDYQFRQIDGFTFEMLAEVSDIKFQKEISQELLKQMKDILQDKKLNYVQFYIRFVDKICPEPKTGKKRLIINTRDLEREEAL